LNAVVRVLHEALALNLDQRRVSGQAKALPSTLNEVQRAEITESVLKPVAEPSDSLMDPPIMICAYKFVIRNGASRVALQADDELEEATEEHGAEQNCLFPDADNIPVLGIAVPRDRDSQPALVSAVLAFALLFRGEDRVHRGGQR